MLASTGIAGNPLEHFNLPEERWTEFHTHYERIKRIDPLGIKTSYPGLMRAVSFVGSSEFTASPCVFLRRRDTLAQAISNFRAMTTGQWWRRQGDPVESPDALLDREAVLKMKAEYERTNNELWPDWFRRHDISPLEVYYEDLCRNPLDTVEAMCQFLGFGQPAKVETGHFMMQRDELSARWQQELEECQRDGNPDREVNPSLPRHRP